MFLENDILLMSKRNTVICDAVISSSSDFFLLITDSDTSLSSCFSLLHHISTASAEISLSEQ